ncbi:phage tail protein [Clostridium aquiflavi]|uniref:Phage tail protein n=1 Tax=Clostridium aquiflavi TaxID=3073603 RepID=A0ABU1EE43_9CLOT|nr:phage tail protein [Clostridium sp. 5N-1]MDR5586612.1 phage tail protein [Clostridium sp. 5N-1]
MEEKFYTILTNIGKAKIANSSALGSKVNFAKIKAGDGNGKYHEPTEDQIKLVNTVWEGNIRNIEVTKENPNWIEIEAIIPSDEGGFTIREFGAFDQDDNLLAISKCPETYKPIICDGSIKELLIKMVLSVSNTDNVSLKIDPTIVVAKKSDVDKVSVCVDEIRSQMKEIANDSYPIIEATGTNNYVGASARITSLNKGTRCTLFVATGSIGNCSLNLNNYGVKNIKDSFGNIVTNLKANIPYNLCYNGSDFILQGKGGGGNAITDKVLNGSTFTNDSGPQTGTMPNQGTKTATLNCGGSYIIPAGYHNGSGKVTANSLASQTQGNGTAAQILSGYSAWVNGSKINGTYVKGTELKITAGVNVELAYKDSLTAKTRSGRYVCITEFSNIIARNSTCLVKYTARNPYDISSITGNVGLYVDDKLIGETHYMGRRSLIEYKETVTIQPGSKIHIKLVANFDNSNYYIECSKISVSCNENYAICTN